MDSPKDRGVSTTASNTNTGAGSTNNASANVSFNCTINQQNQSNVQNNFNVNTNTASNSASGNTGNGQVDSGDADVDIDINTNVGSNSASCGLGQNNEWIEIYNPTDEDVSLKNWTLMDNSGLVTTIHANKIQPFTITFQISSYGTTLALLAMFKPSFYMVWIHCLLSRAIGINIVFSLRILLPSSRKS